MEWFFCWREKGSPLMNCDGLVKKKKTHYRKVLAKFSIREKKLQQNAAKDGLYRDGVFTNILVKTFSSSFKNVFNKNFTSQQSLIQNQFEKYWVQLLKLSKRILKINETKELLKHESATSANFLGFSLWNQHQEVRRE